MWWPVVLLHNRRSGPRGTDHFQSSHSFSHSLGVSVQEPQLTGFHFRLFVHFYSVAHFLPLAPTPPVGLLLLLLKAPLHIATPVSQFR